MCTCLVLIFRCTREQLGKKRSKRFRVAAAAQSGSVSNDNSALLPKVQVCCHSDINDGLSAWRQSYQAKRNQRHMDTCFAMKSSPGHNRETQAMPRAQVFCNDVRDGASIQPAPVRVSQFHYRVRGQKLAKKHGNLNKVSINAK